MEGGRRVGGWEGWVPKQVGARARASGQGGGGMIDCLLLLGIRFCFRKHFFRIKTIPRALYASLLLQLPGLDGVAAVDQAEGAGDVLDGGSGRGAERLREMPDYAAVAGLPPLFLRKALSRDCRRLLFKAATAAAAAAEALREEQLGKAFWVGLDHVIARVPS